MSMRSHRRQPVVFGSPAPPAHRFCAASFQRIVFARPIRWLAWMVWTNRRPVFLATGALLIVIWMMEPGAMTFVPGLLVLALGVPGDSALPGHLSDTAAIIRNHRRRGPQEGQR
jgi:hypothetical protein